MDKLYKWWKGIPRAVRKPLVFMVGFAVVGAGIAMLVLPGPGWAAIFLGFAILATEFAFAERVRDWLVSQLHKLVDYAQAQWRKFRHKPATKSRQKASNSSKKPGENTRS
jgi:uncharacterized protein (TIGR02611 family)